MLTVEQILLKLVGDHAKIALGMEREKLAECGAPVGDVGKNKAAGMFSARVLHEFAEGFCGELARIEGEKVAAERRRESGRRFVGTIEV